MAYSFKDFVGRIVPTRAKLVLWLPFLAALSIWLTEPLLSVMISQRIAYLLSGWSILVLLIGGFGPIPLPFLLLLGEISSPEPSGALWIPLGVCTYLFVCTADWFRSLGRRYLLMIYFLAWLSAGIVLTLLLLQPVPRL